MTMTAILIPAYEPDDRLVDLVTALGERDPFGTVVVVDDGSGPRYAEVFDAARRAGAEVLTDATNRGKGHALKSGLDHIAVHHPGEDVVCADCDGQHAPVDIERVADAVDGGIVLGSRQFEDSVPLRSRFGNTMTRNVFDLATGHRIHDTQTGLRGYPARLLPWLRSIPGDRFEYELEVLLRAEQEDVPVTEVPIATIYEEHHSSHFRTFRDSFRVYLPFLKFSLSSIAAFVVDLVVFFTVVGATGNLLAAAVIARATSATFNFTANHRVVFARSGAERGSAARRYATLVVSLLAVNYLVLRSLTSVGLGVAPAKFATEALLFGLSYQIQRRVVFRSPPPLERPSTSFAGAHARSGTAKPTSVP
ncbi:MAG: bifunctional glycosyltransferase family 2/GtrA family protein [Actinobacteria bacterium]|nr:bifunctional glycosyltransferase family 2/GtrA family protein [Actinomycetota bacterium]